MKHFLDFEHPLLNATGMLGFAPDDSAPLDFGEFGAFVSNPISRTPHTPARARAALPYPGGLLLHSGLPNPGLSKTIRQYGARWAHSRTPVIVHLLGKNPPELRGMVERLEMLGSLFAVEVGIAHDLSTEAVYQLLLAAAGELPIIAGLPLNRAAELAPAAGDAQVSAISLGPPRGTLALENGETISGRLYGPSLFPQTLTTLKELAGGDSPIIAGPGVYTPAQAKTLLEAGALAVQVDTVLWKGWG